MTSAKRKERFACLQIYLEYLHRKHTAACLHRVDTPVCVVATVMLAMKSRGCKRPRDDVKNLGMFQGWQVRSTAADSLLCAIQQLCRNTLSPDLDKNDRCNVGGYASVQLSTFDYGFHVHVDIARACHFATPFFLVWNSVQKARQ